MDTVQKWGGRRYSSQIVFYKKVCFYIYEQFLCFKLFCMLQNMKNQYHLPTQVLSEKSNFMIDQNSVRDWFCNFKLFVSKCPNYGREREGHTGLWSKRRWYLTRKYGKFKNGVGNYYVWWLKIFMIAMRQFQTFLVRIWEIYFWKFERFTKNALTRSVFELEKCSFFLNGSEFRQKLIGTIISVLVRHLCA